ncbi:hypothetical protein KKI24_12945, partial [bacterium]|nr:hypothetical protein [bacterium]
QLITESDEKISMWPRSGTADRYPANMHAKPVSERSERQAEPGTGLKYFRINKDGERSEHLIYLRD